MLRAVRPGSSVPVVVRTSGPPPGELVINEVDQFVLRFTVASVKSVSVVPFTVALVTLLAVAACEDRSPLNLLRACLSNPQTGTTPSELTCDLGAPTWVLVAPPHNSGQSQLAQPGLSETAGDLLSKTRLKDESRLCVASSSPLSSDSKSDALSIDCVTTTITIDSVRVIHPARVRANLTSAPSGGIVLTGLTGGS